MTKNKKKKINGTKIATIIMLIACIALYISTIIASIASASTTN